MLMKATAKILNARISTKATVERAREIRNKELSKAMRFLQDVIEMKRPVPMKRFNRDTAHKPGIAAGRYPVNAAKEILRGLKSVLNNALQKGMNPSKLILSKIDVGMAVSKNRRGSRNTGKLTHVFLEVEESD